jgi:hypothetical protein
MTSIAMASWSSGSWENVDPCLAGHANAGSSSAEAPHLELFCAAKSSPGTAFHCFESIQPQQWLVVLKRRVCWSMGCSDEYFANFAV